MAEKYKKLTVYLDEEQEKVLKDFNKVLTKEQFTLLHYTISLLSRRLDDTSNRIISDVDPNKCDPATLQYSSQL